MATNTTRLGLIKPAYTDPVDVADLNNNMDDIDSAVGATICTSTTRPGTPFSGQLIFETNTDKFLVWTGSVWEESVGGAETLNDLTDVTITSAANNQLLRYDGTNWVNTALASAQLPTGTVLQVLSAARTTSFTTASATFGDWTDITISITPRATSSKVLVFLNATRVTSNQNNAVTDMEIMRVATSLYAPATFQNSGSSGHSSSLELVFLDSPNTTSATTYKGRIRTNGGTATFHAGSITVMEVSG
jgi:hypothetical protein